MPGAGYEDCQSGGSEQVHPGQRTVIDGLPPENRTRKIGRVMADTTRIIKKYPNRRLYDTEASAYVTLEGIRRLVLEGSPFKVVDNKTGADITRAILLQIISEREEKGAPVFTTDLLQSIIRFYGDSLQSQGILGEYLQQSMDFFLDQQNRIRTAADPVALMSEMTNRSLNFWNKIFP